MNWTDWETITVQGRDFAVMVEPDDGMRAPWEEHDGHGIVSEWTSRDKRAACELTRPRCECEPGE